MILSSKVTGITKEVTINSIKITATATKGTNEVSKYYFSKDNGATWSEGQTSNVYIHNYILYSLYLVLDYQKYGLIRHFLYSLILLILYLQFLIYHYYNLTLLLATWSEGQTSNVYTFTGLIDETEYKIKVKVSSLL